MMFRLKKESRRVICALLTAAMLCSDAGVTAYAEETAKQDVFTQNRDEALQEETRAQEEQEKESLEGESQKELLQTAEDSQEEASPEEDSQTGNLSVGDGFHAKEFEKEKAETEGPDAVLAEGSVSENDADEEESVSENDVVAEKNLQATEKTAENITWEIDANGKLTITGTGDFATSTLPDRAPWYERRDEVKTAEVNVTDMTDASYMFYDCANLTSVDVSNFNTSQVTDMSCMFMECDNLTSLDVSNFDTSQVTDMRNMFWWCNNLTNLDVSNFNTSQVTNMGSMFLGCNNLASLDVSNFDTSQVTDMGFMFSACSTLVSLDVSNFDTSQVTDMSYMFNECSNLTSLDVSNFNTSRVGDMEDMFFCCSSLTSLDVSHFDTSQATDMSEMFWICSSLTSLDVSHFDTSRVTDMGGMFLGCNNLTSLDVSNFDTSQVTDMSRMFEECSNLTSLNVSKFDTSRVTNMEDMFCDCSNLMSLGVSNFDTSNVNNMHFIFSGCSNLTSLDVSNFDTSQVTDMGSMFSSCSNLKSLNVSNFDTSQVIDMSHMFFCCSNLMSLDVSNFDTSQVTDMDGMFSDSNLTSLDVSNFDTSRVTDMNAMFSGCGNLTSLDVSNFNTSQVTDMICMFDGCSNLTSLDVSNFNTSQVTGMNGMFFNCKSLASLDVSNFDTSQVTDMGFMFDGCINLTSLDVSNFDTSQVISMTFMFSDCGSLTSLNVGNFDTGRVTDMGLMFSGCHSLTSLDLSSFDLSNIATADGLFGRYSVLQTIHTPYNLKLSVALPAGTWYQPDGTSITELPQNLDHSIIITKDKISEDDPTDKTALNAVNTTVTLADTSGYVYDGTAKTPEVTVSYRTIGSTVALEKDKDYTVTYENNVNAFEDSLFLLTAQNAPKAVITGIGKYSGTVSKAFTIQKAAAPQTEELSVNIEDYQAGQSGCTLDLSGCFAECQKTGYTAGTPVEDDAVAGSVLAGQPSVDEKGLLTYQTSAGTKGDFAVVPVTVSFLNYKDSAINVKIILGGATEEAVPVAAPVADPESGRQLAAGAKVTLTCGTAGAQIYYTTGASEKELAEPTEANARYTEPITIDKDMYIRAAAIKGDNRSKTVTFYYTVLTEAGQVMKPYAVPGQGVVEKGTKVELKSDTPDAIIYYVTGKNPDMLGAVPDDDGHKYTDPIELNEDTVIKAVAEKDGMEDSAAAVFVYRVKTEDIKAPAADPASGNVDQGSYIALTADSDVDIYYTTDGSDPAVSGTARLYEEKIKVLGSAGSKITIRAVAEKKGIYSETVTFTYTVSEKKVEGLNVMLAGREEYIYTGSAIKPAVIVTNNGEELTEGEDYTLQYSNNVNAAENTASKAPKVTVKGKGNLTKSRTVTFTIMPKDIGDEEEVVGGSIVVVKGKIAAPVLFYGGVKLTTKDFAFVNPADAKKKYSENGKLLIKGKGNFTGDREIAVKAVDKEDLKKLTVAVDNAALKNKPLVYDGEAKTLDGYFKVFDTQDKSKSNPLEEYSDYAVVYPENNINAGKVKFTVVGLGDYSGTVTKSYTINPRVVKEDGLMKVYAANGELKDGNSYPFYNGKGTIPELTVSFEDHELVPGKDYKVSYSGNKKICPDDAKAKCTISFIGNYKGSTSIVRKFKITPAEINDNGQIDETMSVAVGDMVYKKPGAYKSVPYVTADGVLLKTSDYKVSYYKDPQRTQELKGKSGAITLTENETQTPVYIKMEGKGNYQGVMTAQYNVRRPAADAIDLSKAKITVGDGNKAEYTGEEVEPALQIQYKAGGGWQTVSAEDIGTALTVTYINNVNKGKATVMVNGNSGKYVGSKTVVFNIVPKNMQ